MPTTTTAISMVNWVLKQHRYDTVSTFDSKEASLVLDLVNESMRDVLHHYDWKWNERNDLVIRCLPSFTTTTGTIASGSTAFSIPSFTGNWIGKDSPERVDGVVAYLAVTDDATFGTTAFRVASASMSSGSLVGTLETSFPGTSQTASASMTFYGLEYALPSTVKSVVSVRDQKRTLQLHQAFGQNEFEQLVPRPLDYIGGDPTVAILSGVRRFTSSLLDANNTGAFTSTANNSLAVYPIPGDNRHLNVTYQYRHPSLVSPGDTVSGVPEDVIDDIHWIAFFRSQLTAFGNDPAHGFNGLNRMAAKVTAKHQSQNSDPFRRRPVRSLDTTSTRRFVGGRLVSPFGSSS